MNKIYLKKEFYIAQIFIILNSQENRIVIDQNDYDKYYSKFNELAEDNNVIIDKLIDFNEDYYIDAYAFKDNNNYVLYPYIDYTDLYKKFSSNLQEDLLNIIENAELKNSVLNRDKKEVMMLEDKYLKMFNEEIKKLNNEIVSLEFERDRKVKRLEKVIRNRDNKNERY